MAHHQRLWSHVQLNGYSQVHWVLRWKCYGTPPGETGQNLPAQAAKISIHSDPTSQIVSPVFASWQTLVSGWLGLLAMSLSFWVAFAILAPNWPQLLFLLGSSSLESRCRPYYFSLWWQHFCCCCASQHKHSILSASGKWPIFNTQNLSHHI